VEFAANCCYLLQFRASCCNLLQFAASCCHLLLSAAIACEANNKWPELVTILSKLIAETWTVHASCCKLLILLELHAFA
jgi:hypothetical protein